MVNTDGKILDVAILCITYNHAKYIRKTLDGFLMQQTEYKFKVFIHDDASTDGTQDILREYEAKYPDLLRVIYEEENQYSKGTDIIGLMRPYIDSARYVAWCEGDDYWFYPHKLQKQCEFMDSHPNTTLCVHNGINWDEMSDQQYCLINELETGYLTYEESVWFSKGHFPTCSFFFRSKMLNYLSIGENFPPVADDPIMYYSINNGQVYYMDKVWAIRTYMHPGSWNVEMAWDLKRKYKHCIKFVDYLNDFYAMCNEDMREYIMIVIISLLRYVMLYHISVEKFCFNELKKGTEYFRELSHHKYDIMCDKCMIELTKQCIDYPQMLNGVLSHSQGEIYIYGAGSEAAKLYSIVDKLGYSVKAFVVSQLGKFHMYMSHQIVSVDDIEFDNPNVTILLGLGMINAYQVISLLHEKKSKNRIIYNGHDITP